MQIDSNKHGFIVTWSRKINISWSRNFVLTTEYMAS